MTSNNMFRNISTNASFPTSAISSEMTVSDLSKLFAYAILFLVATLGNSFIIHCVRTDNRLKSTTNLLVANMAVSDLISVLFLVPIRVWHITNGIKWPFQYGFGQATCKMANFFPDVSTAVSFYSCLFIAVDRYSAVAYPLKGGFRRSRLKYIIPAIWIFSALIVSPYIYFFRLKNATNNSLCTVTDTYLLTTHVYVLIATNFGIPLPIITTLYTLIVYRLCRHKAPGNLVDIAKRKRQQQNRKVIKLSIVVVSLLFLSWGFFSVFTVLKIENRINRDSTVMKYVEFSAQFFAHLSFTFNFFIYLIFNDIYMDNFKSLFLCSSEVDRVILSTV